jgi:hypothetical protein
MAGEEISAGGARELLDPARQASDASLEAAGAEEAIAPENGDAPNGNGDAQLATLAAAGDADSGRETAAGPTPRGGICVLGMHRSGTSLIARAVNLLGVDLGPEEGLLSPAQDNPAGYWESEDLVDINDALLDAFGGTWDAVPDLPGTWLDSAKLLPVRKRAREVLRARFGESELWGWKDPRNCVTLPFWQDIVPAMRYVICVRNPVDVSDSLRARGDSRGAPEHVEDWLRHNALALHHTASLPRIVVHYESFLEDPKSQLKRLARFLNPGEDLPEASRINAAADSIDPELVHGWTSPSLVATDPRVPPSIAAFYMAIRFASDVDAQRKPGQDAAPESWTAVNNLATDLLREVEEERLREVHLDEREERLADVEAEVRERTEEAYRRLVRRYARRAKRREAQLSRRTAQVRDLSRRLADTIVFAQEASNAERDLQAELDRVRKTRAWRALAIQFRVRKWLAGKLFAPFRALAKPFRRRRKPPARAAAPAGDE